MLNSLHIHVHVMHVRECTRSLVAEAKYASGHGNKVLLSVGGYKASWPNKKGRASPYHSSQLHEQDEVLHQGGVQLPLLDQLKHFHVALPGEERGGAGRGVEEDFHSAHFYINYDEMIVIYMYMICTCMSRHLIHVHVHDSNLSRTLR